MNKDECFAYATKAQFVKRGDKIALLGNTYTVASVYTGIQLVTLRFKECSDLPMLLRIPLDVPVRVYRPLSKVVSELKVGDCVETVGVVKYTGRNDKGLTVLVVSSSSGDISISVADKTSVGELSRVLRNLI